MSLNDYKITDASVSLKGVVAAPDKLTGSARENKELFDRLIREVVKGMFNALIDELVSLEGARSIGALQSMSSGDATVQGQLTALATRISAAITSAELTSALSYKADSSVVSKHFKNVDLNTSTGVFAFEREDGTKVTFDTALEKIAINFVYDPASQALKLTLSDGTQQSIPLSSFITETEFSSSTTVSFSVANGKVSATVPLGSITDEHLSSVLRARLVEYVNAAAASALEAKGHAQSASDSAALAKSQSTAAAGSASSASRDAAQALTSKSGADNAAERAEEAAKKAEAAAGGVITDQTYNPQSPNAQSGLAVAEALRTVEVETEAQDVSNGVKKDVTVLGLIEITDSATVKHKARFTSGSYLSSPVYVIPYNLAPNNGTIATKLEIPVPPIEGQTLRFGGVVGVDPDGVHDGGVGKLWELLATDGSVIDSGILTSGLGADDTATLTSSADKLVIYSTESKETSEGVTSKLDVFCVTILDGDFYDLANAHTPKGNGISIGSGWRSIGNSYENVVTTVDESGFLVYCSASVTFTYNVDINTVIGSGGGGSSGGSGNGISFASGKMTISASEWSEYFGSFTFFCSPGGTAFQCAEGENVKMIVIDVADGASLEQRRAAEEACIYASHYLLGPNSGYYDGFLSFGMTGATKPTVNIPIKYTVVTG